MWNILDELAPIVSKTVIVKLRALWYSNHAEELNNLKASVRKVERKWRSTKLTVHREIFVAKRLEYCRRIDGLKSDYHRSRIEQSDTKGLFSIIDDLTGNKKTGSVVLPTKTEVVHFTSRHKKSIEHLKSLKIGGCDVIPKNFVRNLGVYFESTGYPSKHINQICKTSYFSLYKISKI